MSAQDLGKRLLAEVEEIGLDELLSSINLQHDPYTSHFGLKPLDSLLESLAQARPYLNHKQSAAVIELTSLHPSGGKTHIIYHLTALAILPTALGGKQACVVVFDTDGRFSIPRLVQQLRLVASSQTNISDQGHVEPRDALLEEALKHVHVFQPQSLASTLATLQTLPTYLFDPGRHFSSQRSLHFIALDSASAFHWQARADAENALPEIHPSPRTGYAQLAPALKSASRTFHAPVIWTSWHLGPIKSEAYPGLPTRSFRPSLPLPMQGIVDLRLIVRKSGVRKLPAETTVEMARREAESRQAVVEEGKGECFVNEWGMDERVLGELGKQSKGFEFWIVDEGIRFERVEQSG